MISFSVIWALVLRHTRLWRRDPNVLLFGLYWPILDILIWGYLGVWLQDSHVIQLPNYKAVALLGILLWQVVGRGCNVMVTSFTEEFWSNNIVNLFSLPLRISEWIGGIILFYTIMMVITTSTCLLVIYALYDISIAYLLKTFLIFVPPLYFSGIWLGFTCLQVLALLGKRGFQIAAVTAWFLLPFSGAYYPLEVLPNWGQAISRCLPMSYAFQAMRRYVMYQQDPIANLVKSFVLSVLYALSAVILFVYCFNYSKQKGLARLAD